MTCVRTDDYGCKWMAPALVGVRKYPPALVEFWRMTPKAWLVVPPLAKVRVKRPVFGVMDPVKEFVGNAPRLRSMLLLAVTLVKARVRLLFEITSCPLVIRIADLPTGGLVQGEPWRERMLVKPLA